MSLPDEDSVVTVPEPDRRSIYHSAFDTLPSVLDQAVYVVLRVPTEAQGETREKMLAQMLRDIRTREGQEIEAWELTYHPSSPLAWPNRTKVVDPREGT